jgi:hypothetical protein
VDGSVVASDLPVTLAHRAQIHIDRQHNLADYRNLLKHLWNMLTFTNDECHICAFAGLSQRPSATAIVHVAGTQTSLAVAGNAG